MQQEVTHECANNPMKIPRALYQMLIIEYVDSIAQPRLSHL